MAQQSALVITGQAQNFTAAPFIERLLERSGVAVDLRYAALFDKSGRHDGAALDDKVRSADAGLLLDAKPPAGADVRPLQAIARLIGTLGLSYEYRPIQPLKRAGKDSGDIALFRQLGGERLNGATARVERLDGDGWRTDHGHPLSSREVSQVAEIALSAAGKRGKRLAAAYGHPASDAAWLWQEEVSRLHGSRFADIDVDFPGLEMLAHRLAGMPDALDVVLADGLAGEMLAAQSGIVAGSPAMTAAALLAAAPEDEGVPALFRPGLVPGLSNGAMDSIDNPIGQALALALMLRVRLGRPQAADAVEGAVGDVLASGLRTPDIMSEGMAKVSGPVMADAVARALDKRAAA